MPNRSRTLLSGVQNVEVNYGAGKLQVIHDPGVTPLQRIAQAITQMGHQVLIKSGDKAAINVAWWKQPRMILLIILEFLQH